LVSFVVIKCVLLLRNTNTGPSYKYMLTKLHVRIEFLPHRKHSARLFINKLELHRQVIAVYFKLKN